MVQEILHVAHPVIVTRRGEIRDTAVGADRPPVGGPLLTWFHLLPGSLVLVRKCASMYCRTASSW